MTNTYHHGSVFFCSGCVHGSLEFEVYLQDFKHIERKLDIIAIPTSIENLLLST